MKWAKDDRGKRKRRKDSSVASPRLCLPFPASLFQIHPSSFLFPLVSQTWPFAAPLSKPRFAQTNGSSTTQSSLNKKGEFSGENGRLIQGSLVSSAIATGLRNSVPNSAQNPVTPLRVPGAKDGGGGGGDGSKIAGSISNSPRPASIALVFRGGVIVPTHYLISCTFSFSLDLLLAHTHADGNNQISKSAHRPRNSAVESSF